MRVTHLLIATIILTPILGLSQRTKIEENAMDYYIGIIHEQGDKLKSTGQIEMEKVPNYINHVVSKYFLCKKGQVRGDTGQVNLYRNEYIRLGTNATGQLDTANLNDLKVDLKDPIKKVNRVHQQKLRGGLIGLWRRFMSKLFGEPFNVYFLRHIEFEDNFYALIVIVKKDGE